MNLYLCLQFFFFLFFAPSLTNTSEAALTILPTQCYFIIAMSPLNMHEANSEAAASTLSTYEPQKITSSVQISNVVEKESEDAESSISSHESRKNAASLKTFLIRGQFLRGSQLSDLPQDSLHPRPRCRCRNARSKNSHGFVHNILRLQLRRHCRLRPNLQSKDRDHSRRVHQRFGTHPRPQKFPSSSQRHPIDYRF